MRRYCGGNVETHGTRKQQRTKQRSLLALAYHGSKCAAVPPNRKVLRGCGHALSRKDSRPEGQRDGIGPCFIQVHLVVPSYTRRNSSQLRQLLCARTKSGFGRACNVRAFVWNGFGLTNRTHWCFVGYCCSLEKKQKEKSLCLVISFCFLHILGCLQHQKAVACRQRDRRGQTSTRRASLKAPLPTFEGIIPSQLHVRASISDVRFVSDPAGHLGEDEISLNVPLLLGRQAE